MPKMQKPQKAVIDNTKYIAVVTAILSVIMQGVFLILGRWNYTVLTGNVLGAAAAVFNFFVMAMFVQSAVDKDEKDARNTLKLSQSVRFLFLIIIAVIAITVPVFDSIAALISLMFSQVAVTLYPIFFRKKEEEDI